METIDRGARRRRSRSDTTRNRNRPWNRGPSGSARERRRARRRTARPEPLLERVCDPNERRLTVIRPEDLDANRHAKWSRRRWPRKTTRKGERRKSGAVREDAVALHLLLANRNNKTALMGIENRVKPVRGDRVHHCLTKVLSALQSILVLRLIEAIAHTCIGFETCPERAVKPTARDELVQRLDWGARPE